MLFSRLQLCCLPYNPKTTIQITCGQCFIIFEIVTAYQPFYERMQQRLESQEGKRMKKRRQSTVEPVFGSLLNYFYMKRAQARGKTAAHKS